MSGYWVLCLIGLGMGVLPVFFIKLIPSKEEVEAEGEKGEGNEMVETAGEEEEEDGFEEIVFTNPGEKNKGGKEEVEMRSYK